MTFPKFRIVSVKLRVCTLINFFQLQHHRHCLGYCQPYQTCASFMISIGVCFHHSGYMKATTNSFTILTAVHVNGVGSWEIAGAILRLIARHTTYRETIFKETYCWYQL
jgi:hypothetical protein